MKMNLEELTLKDRLLKFVYSFRIFSTGGELYYNQFQSHALKNGVNVDTIVWNNTLGSKIESIEKQYTAIDTIDKYRIGGVVVYWDHRSDSIQKIVVTVDGSEMPCFVYRSTYRMIRARLLKHRRNKKLEKEQLKRDKIKELVYENYINSKGL